MPLALCSLENRQRILDCFLHRHLNYFYVLETLALLDLNVDCQYRNFRLPDLALAELVLDAHRSLGLTFDLMPQGFRGLLQLLCRHIGVSDTGWTSSDCHDFHA